MTKPRRRPEFTAAEVATMAGVSANTVRQWVQRGHVQRNACGAIDGASVVRYLADRGHLDTEPARA